MVRTAPLYLDRGFRQELRSFFGPLDHADPRTVQDFLDPQILDLLRMADPVQIDVVENERKPVLEALVLGDEGEAGAGDRVFDEQAACDPLDQGRLARTERAVQGHDVAPAQPPAYLGPEIDGLRRRMTLKFLFLLHWMIPLPAWYAKKRGAVNVDCRG
jgi:hypothetical protein